MRALIHTSHRLDQSFHRVFYKWELEPADNPDGESEEESSGGTSRFTLFVPHEKRPKHRLTMATEVRKATHRHNFGKPSPVFNESGKQVGIRTAPLTKGQIDIILHETSQ